MRYNPLPKELTISPSTINGLGLFTTKDILKGHIFGISHVKDNRFNNGYIRTPLGGFYNHSKSPTWIEYIDGSYIKLKTNKLIKKGEEITFFTTWFKRRIQYKNREWYEITKE